MLLISRYIESMTRLDIRVLSILSHLSTFARTIRKRVTILMSMIKKSFALYLQTTRARNLVSYIRTIVKLVTRRINAPSI